MPVLCWRCGKRIKAKRPTMGRTSNSNGHLQPFHRPCLDRTTAYLAWEAEWLKGDEAKAIAASLDKTLAHLALTGEVI